jgi:hypothetical protein
MKFALVAVFSALLASCAFVEGKNLDNLLKNIFFKAKNLKKFTNFWCFYLCLIKNINSSDLEEKFDDKNSKF